MRIRCWAMAALAVSTALLGSGRATAQPEPTVEVRLRSVNDLLDKAEYVGGLIGKEDPVMQVRELVKQLSKDGKGVEGIDPKRPFGAYSTLTADVASSPVVVMVPIADEERFLGALKDRLGIVPEKADGGTQKINVPLLNEAYIKFANGYLYAARDPKHLDGKNLAVPKTYFAKDDGSVASVLVRVDKVPAELKTFVIGQLELGVQEELKKNPGAAPADKHLKGLVFDAVVGGAKMFLDDAKEVTLKVFIDPKGDDLSLEITLTPKTGTPLAKTITGLSGKTSLPAGIVATQNPAFQGGAKVELTPDMKKRFGAAVDDALADLVKNAKPEERDFVKRVFDTLAPTIKAAELDAAVTVTAPDAKGKHGLLAAVAVKDGKEIEKLLKDFAPFIPGDAAEVTFDVEKVGKFTLHKVELKNVLKNVDAEFERIFGTKMIWLAISDECVAVSIEPEGKAIRAGLKAKPAPVGVATAEVALAKVLPIFEKNLKPDELKALLKDAFGGEAPTGKDTASLSVVGGDKLVVKVKVKGKAVRLGSTLDVLKGK